MCTKTMTVKEFMSNTQSNQEQLTELENQQWELAKLTCKALIILSAAILPLQLDGILEYTNQALNGSVEAYINQFTPNGMIDVMRVK